MEGHFDEVVQMILPYRLQQFFVKQRADVPVPHVMLDIFEVERLVPISEEINDCDNFPGGDP